MEQIKAEAECARDRAVEATYDKGTRTVTVVGCFSLEEGIASEQDFFRQLPEVAGAGEGDLTIDLGGMKGDREGMLLVCQRLRRFYGKRELVVSWTNLPVEIRLLWNLVLERKLSAPPVAGRKKRWGQWVDNLHQEANDFILFTGELIVEVVRLLTGKARFRWGYFVQKFRECSVDALPIVSLIGILIGLILAYISAVQLVRFGASIFVPNLVSVSIVREMGPVMISIIMAGRTGASYAAEIGSMKVSEEVDAMRALGISPMEYLVLPRMAALTLSMPMLVLYGSILGVISGAVISSFAFDLSFVTYFNQVRQAVSLESLFGGLFKSTVFGALVAFAGTWRGMQSGSSSAEVGRVTTSAVVTAITWIIISDALFAVLFNLYGI